MNQQEMPLANQEKKFISKTEGNRKSKKFEAMRSKLRQRRNKTKFFSEAHEENTQKNTTAEWSKFQKIIFYSFGVLVHFVQMDCSQMACYNTKQTNNTGIGNDYAY